MKEAPTLIDGLIREWMKPKYKLIGRDNWLVSHLLRARKFVLDDQMSAFMADLANASLLTCDNNEKAEKLLNGMRRMARLPHQVTWIEFNAKAKSTRARDEYNATNLDLDEVPHKCGWLCVQHPQLDTSFLAIECASDAFFDDGVQKPVPQANLLTYAWSAEEGPPPWPRYDFPSRLVMFESGGYDHASGQPLRPTGKSLRGRDAPEAVLTGVLSYRSDCVRIIKPPHMSDLAVETYLRQTQQFDLLGELASDARYLWSLLATINDLPTQVVDFKQDRGFVARGRYRKFMDHKIIHLTIPTKIYRRAAKRAIAIARRKGCTVRGHWRRDWRHQPATLCDHEWIGAEKALECRHCHGRRLWIREHQRGDSGLGFTTHDYAVERGAA